MNKAKLIFLILLLSLFVPLGFVFFKPKPEGGTLLFYCAAGMRLPVTEIVAEYKREYGVEVETQFAGSGTLLGNLEASGAGDLYLAADSSYVKIAQDKGRAKEALLVSYLSGGLAVQKGNPHGISGLRDLVETPDLRIGIANPEAAAVGKFTSKVLGKAGVWDMVEKLAAVRKLTVNELANDLKIDAIDVAIIWDATANQYPEVDFINVPEFDAEKKDITIGVLNTAEKPAEALRFARYLTARDRGLKVFEKHGYEIMEGDAWVRTPELLFYSGAMLQPAIRERMNRFKKREGIEIEFVPHGCGILVSKMKGGARPDAYFSCDVSFMTEVSAMFGESTTVSANPIVILVSNTARGKVTSIEDLAKPGVRIGLAHPTNSALGKLTVDLLKEMEIYAEIDANKELDSATGDFLVNQLRGGSLDAIIVYESNARAHKATLEDAHIVRIDHAMAIAHQPFAIGNESKFPRLAQRFFEALVVDEKSFVDVGFQWKLPPPGGEKAN